MVIYNSDEIAIIGLDVDDTSYRYREIMGDCKVYLEFALTQHVELPIGAFVIFQGERFELMSVADVSIVHNRDYEYKVTFEGPQARFSKYRVHNPVDGRLVFEMTAKPVEHLAMIIANLTEREGDGIWSAGVCIDGDEKTISYNHTKLNDALTQLANAYDTEWEVANGAINLNKVEYNKDSPLDLGYGRNAGFKPGVGRTNFGETGQIQRLYVQGGDRNISLREYGNKTLLLPKAVAFKFDGEHFKYGQYTEDGFNDATAVDMETDRYGYSVAIAGAPAACNEESLDLTDIYPKRVGTVTDVRYLWNHQYLTYAELMALETPPTEDDWLEIQCDIVDSRIPESLDFSELLMANDEPLTVIFQKGMLAGREFNATFRKEASTRTEGDTQVQMRPANRFELVRGNFNGLELPNATFRPNADSMADMGDDHKDTYIVVNCCLPAAYICNWGNFSGAEIEMLRAAAKFLYKNKDIQLTFKGEIDDLYSKRNWSTIGGKLKLGGCVSFYHRQVQTRHLITRIVAIKDYINDPYSPEVTLSNESVKGGLSSRISQLGSQTAHVQNQTYALERYARRSFRDAKETMGMLEEALLEGFTERISPIAVQTMQLLLGDESLQFRYVNSKTTPQQVAAGISFNTGTKKLICNAGIIQHMTLGIDSLKKSHAASEYKYWDIDAFESPYLGDALASKKYYLYAKCNKAAQGEEGYQSAEYVLSENAIAIEGVSGYYHLLVGVLNSEVDDDRSFVTLFGFTEILPGRITTDKIVSSEGTTFWDLVQNVIHLGDKLQYDPTNGLILKGTLVQTGSGENVVLGAWCGQFDYNRTYQLGDEVWWQAADGTISTYRYVNSTPSKNHYPSDLNYWQFSAKGVKGDSNLYSDISNEADGIAVGSDGILSVSVSLSTAVKLYLGYDSQTLTSVSPNVPAAFSNKIHLTPNLSTGEIAVVIDANTDFNGVSSVEIPITLACGAGSRTVTYTIIPIKEGEDGAVYKLVPSVDTVKGTRNSSNVITYTPTSVSCQRMARTGSGNLSSSSVGTLKYSVDGGTTEVNYSSAVQVSSAASSGRIIFYWYIGNVLVDRETVPIVVDGRNGADGSDGSDGSDGNGILSVTEDYARSLNGNTPPSSWSETKPTPSAGYFIWTRTTTKFTDTSMPDFVTYSAVYCATNGADGNDGSDGAPGPSSPYRGEYDANTVYYGTQKRCDIVYYPDTGKWYQALSSVGGSFHGILPTNTAYWSDFGANFSNIATGLLFAVEAVIENAVIRKLRTAETGARIVSQDNALTMYDENNLAKLAISGADLEDTPDDASYSIRYQSVLDTTRTTSQINSGVEVSGHQAVTLTKGSTPVVTFTVESGVNNIVIPSLYATAKLVIGTAQSTSGYMYWTGELRFVIDGEIAVGSSSSFDLEFNDGEGGTNETQVYVDGGNVSLSPGTHTLDLEWTTYADGNNFGTDLTPNFMILLPETSGMSVTYPSQVTAVGANGFRAMFSGSQKVEFIKSNGSVEYLLRNGNYGIRITNSAIQFTFNGGGNWYTASREYISANSGYFLKLT